MLIKKRNYGKMQWFYKPTTIWKQEARLIYDSLATRSWQVNMQIMIPVGRKAALENYVLCSALNCKYELLTAGYAIEVCLYGIHEVHDNVVFQTALTQST